MNARSCVMLLGLLGTTPSLHAQTPANADALQVIVAPYFLAPYMDGTLTIGTVEALVNASPGDIFDKLQFGAMLLVEVRKGAWGGTLDGLYMNLEQGATRENVAATATAKQGAVDVSAFRTVLPAVDVLLGARVNALDAGLTAPTPGADIEASKTWVDPLVGVRLWAPIPGPAWRVGLRADVGGFGLGSKLAYQLYPMVAFRPTALLSIQLAYRVLAMNYESGSGAGAFVYDMTIFGPQLGLGFHF